MRRRSFSDDFSPLLALVLAAGVAFSPALAGFDEGLAAYRAEDYEKALAEFQPLAEAGHARAQFYLGYLYEKGHGATADAALAADWYRQAAEQGIAGAQFNLGLALEQGRGVDVDPAAALVWIRQAAEQGNLLAQYKAGEMYEAGTGGEPDLVQAHLWFNLAGKKRFQDAKKRRKKVAKSMDPYDIAEAEMLARHFKAEQERRDD